MLGKVIFRLFKAKARDPDRPGRAKEGVLQRRSRGVRIRVRLSVFLLIAGDKATQQKDIKKAKEIWKKLNK